MSYKVGDRVKNKVDLGSIKAGTCGTVTQDDPAGDASWVLFDGTTKDTHVVNDDLEPC